MAMNTVRPDKVCGIFFNPAPMMRSEVSGQSTIERRDHRERDTFATTCGKNAGAGQGPGGLIVNALLFPYLNNAASSSTRGRHSATTSRPR